MLEPLVSIGLPTFNRPETLERALNSLVNQTYKNLEIIVSDNCSTNEEVDVVVGKFISDTRIKYIKQSQNKGPLFNFNFVLESSSGDYFKWLGDDDWIDEDYIAKCIEVLIDNPEICAAYGYAKMYSDKGEYVTDDAKIDLMQNDPLQRITEYYAKVGNNGCFYGVFRAVDKKYLKVKDRIAEDWIVVARLIYKGKIKMVEGINIYLSNAGVSRDLDQMTKSLNMPPFVRAFPFLNVALIASQDICWGSDAYNDLSLRNRVFFALKCFRVIWARHKVRNEIKIGFSKYLKLKFKMQ